MYPTVQKILEVMSNQNVTFFIPPYQRNYEWSEEQCKVFLDDICKTAEANRIGKKTEHFFGSITYFMDQPVFGQPNKLILIDGQQRITTTMLFLIALRDIIKDDTKKQFIDDNFIKNNKSSDSTEHKIKLKQVETDWEVYKHIVLSEDISPSEKIAAVYKNYLFFRNKLLNMEKNNEELLDLVSYGLNSFSVVTLQLQPEQNPWENPQEIFESMNSIGKPLSLADLVRNYLLLGLDSKTQDEYYHNYWLKIEKLLSGHISNFIRDYMQCIECKPFKQATDANYKELYSQFKSIFIGIDADSLLAGLSKYSEIYSYLINGASTGATEIDNVIADLRMFGTVSYSFLMHILYVWKSNKFTTAETYTILDAFKIYICRRRILGLTSSENKNFPLFTGRFDEIVVNAEDKRAAMFKLLATSENSMRLPNDNEMRPTLSTMNFYNFKYCQFFLALIEEKITKSRPDLTDSNLQIEHIMPQKLSNDWKKVLGENYESLHQEKVNTIGNLTLIRHNQQLGNKSFEVKKDVYEKNSGLQIAREKITDCKQWDIDAIDKRSEWIISFLLDNVLPIPDEMRLTNNFVAKEGRHLSFVELQLIGETIDFINDPTITAKVVSDKEVEFEGKRWRLSPLTREIQIRKGLVNKSGTYSGPEWWEYDGDRLSDV